MLLTHRQVEVFLEIRGLQPPQRLLEDALYVTPAEDWIYRELAQSVQGLFPQLGIHVWKREKNDCGNGARGVAWWAGVLHARTPGAPEAGLALGEFWYVRQGGGPHAIDFAVIPDPTAQPLHESLPGLKLVFFEWQWLWDKTGQPMPLPAGRVELTEKEIRSCGAYYI